MLIPQWEADPLPGRTPEMVFEQSRQMQWAVWEILSERFNIPEGLRFNICEEVAGALMENGAMIS